MIPSPGRTPPRVLAVAGSDSSGGAGIQADVKTVLALGAHPSTAVTAVTAQDSRGVHGVWPVPAEVVRAQLAAVLGDLGTDAVKTGMLATAPTVDVVAAAVAGLGVPLVVDPVLASTSGTPLLDPAGVTALRERLLRLATVVTPNLAEVAALTGRRVRDESDLLPAARALLELGPTWVLVTGGHLPGEPVDLLTDGKQVIFLREDRSANPHTHGSGCTLAAALATALARGLGVPAAAAAAKAFVTGAVRGGYPLGQGPGPVDQGWRWRARRRH